MTQTAVPPHRAGEDADAARVLAVVVSTDGEATLPRTLDALAAQTHAALDVVAVDNGSHDRSRELLLDALGHDRVLVAERDLGFGAAVSMALDAEVAADADHVLLVHDDLALRPDAVHEMVAHLQASPRVAVVGCKLVDWDDPGSLQAVGMTVDLTGRADSGIDEDERDQGQRDVVRRTLYVSTAGMLLRRTAFDALGGFDRRYHLFRDDLDLCWRAWLAGWEVEVVPDAVGVHDASASNYRRLGQTAFLGPRYFAERNTLATLLKDYAPLRLAYVVPAYLLVGVAKVVGFLLTRRFSDAYQTVRAWVWNVLHLRETWRLRRRVQETRERSDRELAPLFARAGPRVRAYVEAVAEWISAGDDGADDVLELELRARAPGRRTVRRRAGRRFVAVAGGVLGVLWLLGARVLFSTGPLRGGELAPWPDGWTALLGTYVAPWTIGPGDPSPARAVLGVIGALATGSGWLAPRLVLLLAPVAAWILVLRLGRLLTTRRLPRVLGAAAYVLSPPFLATLRTGRLGALAVAVLLPLLALALAALVQPAGSRSRAWRATAGGALAVAAAVAFAPVVLPGIGLALLVTAAAALAARDRTEALLRVLLVGLGAATALWPWIPTLGGVDPTATVATDPVWRWLLLAPDLVGFPSVLVGAGLVAGAVIGVLVAVPTRPLVVSVLMAALLVGVGSARTLGRLGPDAWGWPGVPLLVAAGAAAGLVVLAFARAERALAGFDFGWRQLAAGLGAALMITGLGLSAFELVVTGLDGLTSEEDPLPAFIAADVAAVGPFDVLVLARTTDGALAWQVVTAQGPTLASYGAPPDRDLQAEVAATLTSIAAGTDPAAASRLGALGIRYVVLPVDSPDLQSALDAQLRLEPQPVATGSVLLVDGWLPWTAAIDAVARDGLAADGTVPLGGRVVALAGDDPTVPGPAEGLTTLARPAPPDHGWRLLAAGERRAPEDLSGVSAWDLVPEPELRNASAPTRAVSVAVQAVVVLLLLSLALRAPRFARTERT